MPPIGAARTLSSQNIFAIASSIILKSSGIAQGAYWNLVAPNETEKTLEIQLSARGHAGISVKATFPRSNLPMRQKWWQGEAGVVCFCVEPGSFTPPVGSHFSIR